MHTRTLTNLFGFLTLGLLLGFSMSAHAYSIKQSGSCVAGTAGRNGSNGTKATCIWGGGGCKDPGTRGGDGGSGSNGGSCTLSISDAKATDSITLNVNVSGGAGGKGGAGGHKITCGAFKCSGGSKGNSGANGRGGSLTIVSDGKVKVGQLHFTTPCPVSGGSKRASNERGMIKLDGVNVTSHFCR